MRVTRMHVEARLAVGDRIALPASAAGHLVRVLRAGVGAACVLFNGDGRDYDARIIAIGKRGVEVEIVSARALDNESPLRITLLPALTRGEKMDWLLQKATELGVAGFVPVHSERSEVKLDRERAGRRGAHWHAVIVAACEQSGRAIVPPVAPPCPLATAVHGLAPATARLVLDPQAAHGLETHGAGAAGELVLAIGPEGGWSPRDLQMLRSMGFKSLRLGPRILRAETAGIAAIAALQACCGDFRHA